VAEAASAWRANWPLLLGAGLLVFGPLGVIEVLDHHLQEPLADAEGPVDAGTVLAAIAAAVGQAVAALLGEVIYAGIVAAAVISRRSGEAHSLRRILRDLPLGRLIVVDLLWVAVVAVGLIAFVVPGIVFMSWFALVAPAVEVEGRGPVDAFRRSRELVRRRFWLVFGLIVPILLLEDVLGNLAQSASFWGLGDGLAGDWAGAVLANLVTSPPYALVAVILFLGLRDPQGEPPRA
jgi:hypothetical protein